MVEQRWQMSRREVMRAVAIMLSAGVSSRLSSARAADKLTRQQADYQDTPNGIYSCGSCALFERPHGCKAVEGEVSQDGWCKVFELQD